MKPNAPKIKFYMILSAILILIGIVALDIILRMRGTINAPEAEESSVAEPKTTAETIPSNSANQETTEIDTSAGKLVSKSGSTSTGGSVQESNPVEPEDNTSTQHSSASGSSSAKPATRGSKESTQESATIQMKEEDQGGNLPSEEKEKQGQSNEYSSEGKETQNQNNEPSSEEKKAQDTEPNPESIEDEHPENETPRDID